MRADVPRDMMEHVELVAGLPISLSDSIAHRLRASVVLPQAFVGYTRDEIVINYSAVESFGLA
jgi:hypothetical protein